MRQIIVVSNPFGFGPSGKAIAIMTALCSSNWPGEIIFAASEKCLQTLPSDLSSKIKIEKIDERNENQLEKLFRSYKDPLVVVVLNRAAIVTTKKLGLKAVFVDSLSYLWNRIPKEYLSAGIYYAFDIFNAREKVKNIPNTKLIPAALGKLPKPVKKKTNMALLHIGGFTNPIVPGFSRSYLKILSEAIREIHDYKITIAGGKIPLAYMKRITQRDDFMFEALPRTEFIDSLNKSGHFVTTPGMTATLEAFALNTPVSFLPPSNLSQWKQGKLFKQLSVVKNTLEWKDYLKIDRNFDSLSEKEAIPLFGQMARALYKNNNLKQKIVLDIRKIIKNIPDNKSQRDFIKKMGTNGAKVVVKDVLNMAKCQ